MMPFEIPGFGFHTQVLQCIAHSVLYSMALFISWIFDVQFDRKTIIYLEVVCCSVDIQLNIICIKIALNWIFFSYS